MSGYWPAGGRPARRRGRRVGGNDSLHDVRARLKISSQQLQWQGSCCTVAQARMHELWRYLYTYVHMHIYIYIYVYVHICAYVYIYISMHICMCMCMYVYIYLCTHVCIYICTCVNVYIYVYIRVHTHLCREYACIHRCC